MSNYDKYKLGITTDPGSIVPNAIGGVSNSSVSGGPFQDESQTFWIVAGAGGSADDVTLNSAALPYKAFITQVRFIPLTGVASSNVTLRSAAAGAGTAYSSALASVTAGTVAATTTVATAAAAAGSSLYLRRSDSGIAGILQVSFLPTV
jgi:hypothetical protein